MNAFLIKGGTVYRPEQRQFSMEDLAIVDGKIVTTDKLTEYKTINAKGCIVTTGFIDYHVHYFNRGTENGVNPDAASFPCGITTAVDGGSCGAATYELYQRTVMAQCNVDIFNALLMGSGGQTTDQYTERLEANYFDITKIKRLFEANKENLVALKTRMSKGIISKEDAVESMRRTIALAEEIGCNVMVHITNPVIDLEELAGMMRQDDVICHIFQNIGGETILDETGRVKAGIWKAMERGVLFDASNGKSNYDLEICRQALAQGFYPQIISSDNNTSSFYLQPLHSLPRIMSKYMDMGMKLEDILDAVTITPARLIHQEERASLAAGTVADITIFQIKEKNVEYFDVAGHVFYGKQVIVPQFTIKGGKVMYSQADFG